MNQSIPATSPDALIASLPVMVKRHPYIKYSQYPEVVKKVMEILKFQRRGDIPKISAHTHFKIRMLYNWANELKKDPTFNPLNKKCGQHCRIFTDSEEDAIADYIIECILMSGILFTDEDFEELIIQAFLEKHRNDPEDVDIPQFNASKGFIYDFKKNHGITSRKCHTKRRPDNKKYDTSFLQDMEWLFSHVPLKYIVNVDETGWEVVPGNIKVWHLVGQDHVVRYVNGNEKDKITVVAAIAADGSKLPLQFIAKGETKAVIETQIGDVAYHMRTYSSSGWTTSETFKKYLIGIRNFYSWDDENTIHLLLDVFKAHLTDDVLKLAKELNIKLHLIPAGMTDELQPLDKKIFGPMKTFARKLFRLRYKDDNEKRRTKRDACEDMVRSWEVEYTGTKINLNRHHRKYCTASAEMRAAMDEMDEYKA